MDRWRLLTRHAVTLGSWECRSIHVGDTAWGEGVEGLLDGEVEKPVIVTWEECETVELAGSAAQLGVQLWLPSPIDGCNVLGEGSDQEAGAQDALAEHGADGR